MIELRVEPGSIPVGVLSEITIRLVSRGHGPCTNVRLKLALPAGLDLRGGDPALTGATVDGDTGHDVRLTVVARAPGLHVIAVRDFSYRDSRGDPVRRRNESVVVRVEERVSPAAGEHRPRSSRHDVPRWCDCGSIFVSYRRADTGPVAAGLARDLPVPTGHRVFHNHASLRGGDRFRERIVAEVASSAVLLVLIGPSWLQVTTPTGRRRLDEEDDLVRTEIRTGLTQLETVVVPVRVGGVRMPHRSELPRDIAALAALQAVTFRSADGLSRLVMEARRGCRRGGP